MIELELARQAIHAAIDRRCALELERIKEDAEFNRRSLGQQMRRLRESLHRSLT